MKITNGYINNIVDNFRISDNIKISISKMRILVTETVKFQSDETRH